MAVRKTRFRRRGVLFAAAVSALLMQSSAPAAASDDTIASVISRGPVASTTECHGGGPRVHILQCALLKVQRLPGGTWIAWGLLLALLGGLTVRGWHHLVALAAAVKELDVSGLAEETDDQNETSPGDKQTGENS